MSSLDAQTLSYAANGVLGAGWAVYAFATGHTGVHRETIQTQQKLISALKDTVEKLEKQNAEQQTTINNLTSRVVFLEDLLVRKPASSTSVVVQAPAVSHPEG